MKNRKNESNVPNLTVDEANALSEPNEETAIARRHDKPREIITLPADRAAQQQAVRDVFVNMVGANVLSKQMHGFIGDGDGKTNPAAAELYIEAIRESVNPSDAIEEMLVVQMAWTHARLAKLSTIAVNQEQTRNVRVINDACDRAASTFRRQLLALAEYRRPAQPGNFVAIRHANVANNQVIANGTEPNPQNRIASNEQGSTPALPPVAGGIELPAGDGTEKQAVAEKHRPQDRNREGPIQAERDEAR